MIKKILILGICFAIVLPSLLPFFNRQFFHMHDYTHVARLAEMDRAIKDGHFPVRWSKNFGFGFGMPLFNFYGPTPFYLADIFHTFWISYVNSIKLVFMLTSIGGFLAMYWWAKEYWGRLGALISATAFAYVPYRAVDMYVRGSLNELYGMTFAVTTLLCLDYLIRTNKHRWIFLGSASYALLATSHNLSAMIITPAIGAFIAVRIGLEDHKIRWSLIKKSMIVIFAGILLSAFYTLPSFVEKNLVALNNITGGYFHYSQHFLYLRQFINSPWGYGGSIYGLEDGISFEIGKIHLLLAVLAFSSMWISKKLTNKSKTIILTSLGIVGVSMLMATFKTKFIYDHLPVLQYVQFPWRFLSVISIFISFAAGASIHWAKKIHLKPITYMILIIVVLIVYNQNYFKPDKFLDNASDVYYDDEYQIQTKMSAVLPDYMPPGVPTDLTPATARFQLKSGENTVDLVPTINRTHEFLVAVPLKEKTVFTANIFTFPVWNIFINDQPVSYSKQSSLPILQIELDPQILKTDQVYISGYFSDTTVRIIGNMVSLLTFMSLVYWWYAIKGKQNA